MSLISNRKATFNYEINEKKIAGIELFGHEVKAVRKSQGSLEGSYVIVRGGEAFLINSYIPPYQPNNMQKAYDERRNRKLLLKKKEIAEIADAERKKIAIVPLSIFAAGPKIKIEIAFATGKKKHDKRQSIKKRDTEKELGRRIKG